MADDDELFRKAVQGVKPIGPVDRVALKKSAPDPLSLKARRERALALRLKRRNNPLTDGDVEWVKPGDWLVHKKNGVQEGVFRKLRLGKYPIQARLDLHRLTVKEARDKVWYFVEEARRQGLRTVLITHGKGERSEPQAVLKSYTHAWLKQMEEVLAFHTAQPRHGGVGAVYVLLRKNEEERLLNRERFQ